MREPPTTLADETIRAAVYDAYGLAVADLTFMPLGHDSYAWVYRLDVAGSAPYFLKVRLSVTNAPSLLVPRYLQDHGVATVIAPLPTRTGALWAPAADHALILYPFVAGSAGMEIGMTPAQWRDYGVALRQIHDTPVAPALAQQLRRETYIPDGAKSIRKLEATIGEQSFDDPVAHGLATFWHEHREQIETLLSRGEALGRRLAQTPPPLILCHADIHTNNLLLDAEQQVWVVDWDETMLAPRERDLMFVVGGISAKLVGPREEEFFFTGYGPIDIDPLALAYYRYAWAISDIGAYGEEVLFRPDLGEYTRQSALDSFTGLFAPGEIVSLAFGSGFPV